jgi:hypothetical protein
VYVIQQLCTIPRLSTHYPNSLSYTLHHLSFQPDIIAMAGGTMTNPADNDLPADTPTSTAYEPELQALLLTPSSTPVSSAKKDAASSVAPEADTAADEAVAPRSPSPAPQAVDLRQVPNLSSLSDNQEMKYIGLLLDPSKM